MILYHGTNARHLSAILQRGIRPRGKRKSTWECESCPDAVYLTRTMPEFYALAWGDHSHAVVFEIDTGSEYILHHRFTPDEDFLEHATREADGVAAHLCYDEAKLRVAEYRARLMDYDHYWKESLQCYGTCAYHGPIELGAITRYAIIERKHLPRKLLLDIVTQTANPMALKIRGVARQRITEYVFGSPLKAEHLFVETLTDTEEDFATAYENFLKHQIGDKPGWPEYLKDLQDALDARKGITVVDLRWP